MIQKGRLNWIFSACAIHGFDILTVTNLNETPAHLSFDVYFTDIPPVKGLTADVGAERVACFKLSEPLGDQKYKIPDVQYSLVVHSDVPVVVAFGGQGYSY